MPDYDCNDSMPLSLSSSGPRIAVRGFFLLKKWSKKWSGRTFSLEWSKGDPLTASLTAQANLPVAPELVRELAVKHVGRELPAEDLRAFLSSVASVLEKLHADVVGAFPFGGVPSLRQEGRLEVLDLLACRQDEIRGDLARLVGAR